MTKKRSAPGPDRKPALPPFEEMPQSVQLEVRRILRAEAQRRLNEQLEREALEPAAPAAEDNA